MNKLFIVLLSATIIALCSATCTNPLLETFGFDLEEGGAAAISGLKYCKSLQSGTSCCTAATVNGFQDKADALLESLTDAVSKRDTFLYEVRTSTIPELSDKLTALAAASQKVASKLGDDASTLTMIESYEAVQTQLDALVPQLKEAFSSFQVNRAACVIKLVTFQTAAWCFACNPADHTDAFDNDDLLFSDELSTTLAGACFDYLELSAAQSSLLTFSYMSTIIEALTEALNTIAEDGATEDALAALLKVLTDVTDDGSDVTDVAQKVVTLPTGCTSTTSCSWITEDLFAGGEIDQDLLALGGTTLSLEIELPEIEVPDLGGNRLLSGKNVNRRMSGSGWNPDEDESGVTVTFEANPAGINNSAWRQGGFIGCFVALVAMLLF